MKFNSASSQPGRLERVKQWVKTHRTRSIVIASVILLIGVGAVAFALLNQPAPKLDTTPIKVSKKPQPVYYSPLSGEKVASEADRIKPVTAFILENSPDARPQSGLKQAEVVYEAIAEAGITRFLAVYQQHKPQLIGPVRSVRPYYLDWAKPYDASIAHIGGSAKALAEVRNGSYRDIDQFFNADAYYRATDRFAPHNVYTSFERIDSLNNAKGFKISNPKEMERTDGKPAETPTASNVIVTISSTTFNSSYTYDKASNAYLRSQGGEVHTDREDGQIAPAVVVVMKVDETTVFEDTDRQQVQTLGSGAVTIFQNGTAIEGNWNKATSSRSINIYRYGRIAN